MGKSIMKHMGLRRAFEDIERLRFAGYEPMVTRNGIRCPKSRKNTIPGEFRRITSHWDEKLITICLKVMDGELELLDDFPADEFKVGDNVVEVLHDNGHRQEGIGICDGSGLGLMDQLSKTVA